MGWASRSRRSRRSSYSRFPEYIPVSERRQESKQAIKKLKNKGELVSPVIIDGRKITKTFWGDAWCKHLESFSDFENRLGRGRSYVRNGSVINLGIEFGKINALVQGSSLYKVSIEITSCSKKKWQELVSECAGKIDSLIELLQGKFSKSVMQIITNKNTGLFPDPNEIKLNCSCPDYATMCKHVAATLYGVGARLDSAPEKLFVLRQVDHFELINPTGSIKSLTKSKKISDKLETENLADLFNIDIEETNVPKTKITKTAKIIANTTATPKPAGKKPINELAQSSKIKKIVAKKLVKKKAPKIKTIAKNKADKSNKTTKTKTSKPVSKKNMKSKK